LSLLLHIRLSWTPRACKARYLACTLLI
jgi:hypothetical protein